MAMSLLPDEAVIGDGVALAVAETLAEVVPTEVLVLAGTVTGTVVLEYTTGEVVGATTLEVVTGWLMVQGQLVMVSVVASVTV
jgi:hypothetical protein